MNNNPISKRRLHLRKFPIVASLAYLSCAIGLLCDTGYAQALLLNYKFDQSSGRVAVDSAANPANGTLTGAGSTWTNMGLPPNFQANYAYSNSGGNATYVTAGDVAKLDGLSSFTFTGWLNVESAVTTQFSWDRVLSKRGSSGSYFDLRFADVGGGNIGLTLEISTGSGTAAVSSGAMNMSDWFFFAVTRDATTGLISFYYGTTDGSLVSVGGGTGTTGVIADNSSAFMVGNVAANVDRAPNADFSDIRIYDGVLNLSALQAVQLQAIPEPGAFGLALGGVVVFLLLVRRKAKHA